MMNCSVMNIETTASGGVIGGHASAIIIDNVAFERIQSMGTGGAISLTRGALAITNAYFYSCRSHDGGAIYLEGVVTNSFADGNNTSSAIITNTWFEFSAAWNGGAIALTSGTNVTMDRISIVGCTSYVSGGAVFLGGSPDEDVSGIGATLFMYRSWIYDNDNSWLDGSKGGGAINCRGGTAHTSMSRLYLIDTVLDRNRAKYTGAAINSVYCTVMLIRVIAANQSYGAAMLASPTIVGSVIFAVETNGAIINSTFADNTAYIGTLSLNQSPLVITGTRFVNNRAKAYGSVYVVDSNDFKFAPPLPVFDPALPNTYINNTAIYGGNDDAMTSHPAHMIVYPNSTTLQRNHTSGSIITPALVIGYTDWFGNYYQSPLEMVDVNARIVMNDDHSDPTRGLYPPTGVVTAPLTIDGRFFFNQLIIIGPPGSLVSYLVYLPSLTWRSGVIPLKQFKVTFALRQCQPGERIDSSSSTCQLCPLVCFYGYSNIIHLPPLART
jgi:hypothetical protein